MTLKVSSNALVTLVRAEQDCFKELFEAVDITRRISEFIWQRVPDRRTGNWKSPGTAVCVESTARNNEPVSRRRRPTFRQSPDTHIAACERNYYDWE